MNLNDAFAIKYNTRQQDADTNRFEALSKNWLGQLASERDQGRLGLETKLTDFKTQPSSLLSGAPAGTVKPKVAQGAQPAVPGGLLSGTTLSNMPAFTLEDEKRSPLNFKTGTTRVPGKGSGKVDTVPAKLAPGEAVLNKAAAEKMGRDKIAKMNKAGTKQMGMSGQKKPGHYAQGTENVKPAPKPPLIKRIADMVMGAPKPVAAPAPAQTGPRNVGPAVGGGKYQYSTYGADPDARLRRSMGEE